MTTDRKLISPGNLLGGEVSSNDIVTADTHYVYTVPQSAIRGAWENDAWFKKNKHLIAAAMHNGLSLFNEDEVIDLPLVKLRLSTSVIPHTPKMKLDSLLRYIADQIEVPGKNCTMQLRDETTQRRLYFLDDDEFGFYVQTLKAQELITIFIDTSDLVGVRLTFKGLAYLAELEDAGSLSKYCFVAMAFDNAMKESRSAIERAIEESGYIPVIVDDRNIDSDKTINDEIIAQIRHCKFCISDFTLQRNGVYFEAGFALGLGKPVIYVCEKENFSKSHFDLKPFQHILYESAEELQTGLVRKINAWIQ